MKAKLEKLRTNMGEGGGGSRDSREREEEQNYYDISTHRGN